MDRSPPRLEATGLTCVRGDRRLFHQLSLALDAGQALQVEGENGAGKTSLLRILAGLGLPALGEVRWDGMAIARQRELFGQALLYLGHLAALKDELTPEENLLTDAQLGGWPGVDRARVLDALERMGLRRVAALPARVLSAGQRRRTALTRLMLSPATLWVLDEPFNALDVAAADHLVLALAAHTARGGMVVFTSHQPMSPDRIDLQRLRLSP